MTKNKKKKSLASYILLVFALLLLIYAKAKLNLQPNLLNKIDSVDQYKTLISYLNDPPEDVFFQGILGHNSVDTYQALSLSSEIPKINNLTTSIIGRYQSWTEDNEAKVDTVFLNRVRRVGVIPYITWEPWAGEPDSGDPSVQPKYQLSNIIRGDFDDYIRTYAKDLKNFKYPVFVRFAHEMNGNWYPWGSQVNSNTPDDYVATWRHVHDIFEEEGVNNVVWVWAPNEPFSGKFGTQSDKYSLYYPGDEYVDWVGFSAYNWGKYHDFSINRSFKEIVSKAYPLLLPFNKPILLAETNSSTIGVNKSDWIKQMKEDLQKFPKIRGIVWYESGDELFKIEKDLFFVKTAN